MKHNPFDNTKRIVEDYEPVIPLDFASKNFDTLTIIAKSKNSKWKNGLVIKVTDTVGDKVRFRIIQSNGEYHAEAVLTLEEIYVIYGDYYDFYVIDSMYDPSQDDS
jgi:hypothetical protein